MENLPALPGGATAWAAGGPMRPRSILVIGSWYMLREIEFSNAETRSVHFNMAVLSITLTLPVSKADPSALGTSVTHGCCCLSVAIDREGWRAGLMRQQLNLRYRVPRH